MDQQVARLYEEETNEVLFVKMSDGIEGKLFLTVGASGKVWYSCHTFGFVWQEAFGLVTNADVSFELIPNMVNCARIYARNKVDGRMYTAKFTQGIFDSWVLLTANTVLD
jgi:hypothetical protein